MPQIELRIQAGVRSPEDISLQVQDRTYSYLMETVSPEVRISAFFDKDQPWVEARYAEVFVHDDCRFKSMVAQIIPGSRARTGVTLPGLMKEGEQLTILVKRSPLA